MAGELIQCEWRHYQSVEITHNEMCKQQATLMYRALLRRGKGLPIEEVLFAVRGSTRGKIKFPHEILDFAVRQMPNLFEVKFSGGQHLVAALVTIQFCKDFESKNGCQRKRCPSLHVCRHFVKDKCTFGARCKKPHHFKGEHTSRLLRENLLDGMDDCEVKNVLCRHVQFSLDDSNLNPPKFLQVCQYYNVKIGCSRGIDCPYLHVCKFFATSGVCKFGGECIRNHGFSTAHCQKLLMYYGIGEKTALSYLAATSQPANSDVQQTDEGCTPSEVATPTSRINLDFEDHLTNTICSYHLKGKCYAGNECLGIHIKQLYVWQFKRHNELSWQSLSEDISREIEILYCQAEIEACLVRIPKQFKAILVDFLGHKSIEINCDDLQATNDTVRPCSREITDSPLLNGDHVSVRRLSTAAKEGAMTGEVFATTWYYHSQDENGNWRTLFHDQANAWSDISHKTDISEFRLRPKFTDMQMAKQNFEWHCNQRVALLLQKTEFPLYWRVEKDPSLEFVQVPLEPTDKIHSLLSGWILKSMPSTTIIKVTLVQNVDLWKDYQTSRELAAENNYKEELLFLGTTSRKIRSTYQQGFPNDRRAAKDNNATYCNELSSYPQVADLQAMEDSRGYRHIFIARALVSIRKSHMVSDIRNVPTTARVSLPDPVIFPVTNKKHLYPEFLVTYMNHATIA